MPHGGQVREGWKESSEFGHHPIGSENEIQAALGGSLWEVSEGNMPQVFSFRRVASTSIPSSSKNLGVVLDFTLSHTSQYSVASKRNPNSCHFSLCPRSHHCLCSGDENSFLTGSLLLHCPIIHSSHGSHGALSKPVSPQQLPHFF